MVSAGSADRFVYIWDTNSRKIMYKLPGHLGSVNDVDFHKVEPIGKLKFKIWGKKSNFFSRIAMNYFLSFSVLSASSDKQIYLGEFDDSMWGWWNISNISLEISFLKV